MSYNGHGECLLSGSLGFIQLVSILAEQTPVVKGEYQEQYQRAELGQEGAHEVWVVDAQEAADQFVQQPTGGDHRADYPGEQHQV